MVDFLNVVRGHIDTDAGLTDVIPVQGMRSAPHLDFAGEIRAATNFPTFHAAKIQDVATARHAIASGKLDMVGMTRAHMADPHIVAKILRGARTASAPASARTTALTASIRAAWRLCLHNPATGRELEHAADHPQGRTPATPRRHRRRRPGGLEAARVAAERGHEVIVHRGREPARRPDPPDRAGSPRRPR
jgi:hypothetical protein